MKGQVIDMCKVLVVEDEIFVAIEIENAVAELGFEPIGIAADLRTALEFAGEADVALVDLNLRDGPTGQAIGRVLAQEHGVTVMFMTANPAQLGAGVPGTVGVMAKPVMDDDLREAVCFAVARHHRQAAVPPGKLQLFS